MFERVRTCGSLGLWTSELTEGFGLGKGKRNYEEENKLLTGMWPVMRRQLTRKMDFLNELPLIPE